MTNYKGGVLIMTTKSKYKNFRIVQDMHKSLIYLYFIINIAHV